MRQEEHFLEAFGARRSRQGSTATSRRHHVATSPSHDVEVNYYRSQPGLTSRRHHVATSSRRDVTTSRRLLKILHLIIKCEEARESRVLVCVRLETDFGETCNTDWRILLVFLYWILFIYLVIFGFYDGVLHALYFVYFFHDVLNSFLGLHQTLSQTMD